MPEAQDLSLGGDSNVEQEKDFILFVDKEGRFKGDYDPLPEDTLSGSEPQGPINEETGEINWDCPCLQSALAPPCGEFFREAFSCFVASKTEPKGSDCLEKFAAMQDCFRAHPDIYLKGLDMQEVDVHESGQKSVMNTEGEAQPADVPLNQSAPHSSTL